MKQVILRQGGAVVEEVPAPFTQAGTVLVMVDHSCISIGTETSGLRSGGLPLWKRALRQPENVAKAIHSAASVGPRKTWALVQGQLAAGNATGYSAAGVVIDVGEGVEDLLVGDRVACAGAQYAHHAELIRVPRNLVVPVPDSVSLRDAATVTLGAIAMQGVRRLSPTLGETFVVMGLGAIGQITAQLLKASGCRVIGTDLDAARVSLATELGTDLGIAADETFPDQQVARLTEGLGADGVIITAASNSDELVSLAFRMCRKKGRVVLVGDVGLSLKRSDFYAKEIDFLISCSYGPGRYDRQYEERGLDYPAAYVRWTENRNMAEYLRLVGQGQVSLTKLVNLVRPVNEAAEAYAEVSAEAGRPIIALLSYPGTAVPGGGRRVVVSTKSSASRERIGVAVVGAGGFAKGMHLPNLRSLSKLYEVRAVVSRTGHNAVATARQYEARYATTDVNDVLGDPQIDLLIITTRHDLHARLALQALKAGKHVLLEKPLCITSEELQGIRAWFDGAAAQGKSTPVLLTGFNRRFSPYAEYARSVVRERSAPLILNYRMNAGYIPLDHWTHGSEGGGRNIGEACHIYDLATSIIGERCTKVQAAAVRPRNGHYSASDNFVATCAFADGSVASVTYTAMGSRDHSKEQFEIYVDGKVVVMDDYRSIRIAGSRKPALTTRIPEKGQKEELEALGIAIQNGNEWPSPLWQQLQAMEMAFAVDSELAQVADVRN